MSAGWSAIFHGASRTDFVAARKSGSLPASNSFWRAARAELAQQQGGEGERLRREDAGELGLQGPGDFHPGRQYDRRVHRSPRVGGGLPATFVAPGIPSFGTDLIM
jgi:hypothetical protein